MKNTVFDRLILFLSDLEQKGISYTLAHHREEAIMVLVAAPGARWEIEFVRDGSVDVECFISDGEIRGDEALSELFARYSDVEQEEAPALTAGTA